MNFLFMILFVLIILLLLCNFIKDYNKNLLTIFLLTLFIINDIYLYFEKDKHKEGFSGMSREYLTKNVGKLELKQGEISGINYPGFLKDYDETNNFWGRADESLMKDINEENYISGNINCSDLTPGNKCTEQGCYENTDADEQICKSNNNYCNSLDYDKCIDDTLCTFKGESCISKDHFCENLISKEECSKNNNTCKYDEHHQKCFSR